MAKELEGNEFTSKREDRGGRGFGHGGRDQWFDRPREPYEQYGGDIHPGSLPKLASPVFQGVELGIWFDKCMYYFTIYEVPESLWASTASMHMQGNTAKWW